MESRKIVLIGSFKLTQADTKTRAKSVMSLRSIMGISLEEAYCLFHDEFLRDGNGYMEFHSPRMETTFFCEAIVNLKNAGFYVYDKGAV